jgi:subtilisin family serine protease
VGTSFIFNLLFPNKNELNSVKQEGIEEYLHRSNNGKKSVIVFFNESTFETNVKTRFEFYGGIFKENEEWNSLFNNFSGFAGVIPIENISEYKSEFPNINIETDEIIEVQMNYASIQTQSVNSTWYINGYKGDTNSSIAVLDSGVNLNHDFLQGRITGWQDFIGQDPMTDDNGHGTFISSVIAGTGTSTYNSSSPSMVNLYGNYSHLDLFDEYLPSKNYSVKIFSTNISKADSIIAINSTSNFQLSEIDEFWFELYLDSSLVNSSHIQNPNQYYAINHNISLSGKGIYDLYIKYHKKTNSIPLFSFNSSVSFFPESYTEHFNHFTGIANATNILAYKIVNQSGKGYVSDLISALASVIKNRTTHHIISVCLSIGTLGDDVTAINAVIDEVIEKHILVIIAAGNKGIEGSEPFNKLGMNKNAIVVGAINDKDQITTYSSMGRDIGDGILKPDIVAPGGSIVAPGGSKIPGHRSIISADAKSNESTALFGTSISTAIVSAAINILIEAKWGNWTEWDNQDLSKWVKILKAILLMTASETNLERENDPETEIDES